MIGSARKRVVYQADAGCHGKLSAGRRVSEEPELWVEG